ncbi:MAG: ATP-binding cassette domain-containing protein [Acidobacteriaceae bacterium]
MHASPLLDVRGLTIRFPSAAPRAAVDGISFHIDRGEVLGLVGESGSGKSLTSLAILRLLAPGIEVAGEILFAGRAASGKERSEASATGSHGASGKIGESADVATDLLRLPEAAMRRRRGSDIAMIFQEPMTALNPVMTIGAQIAEAVRAHHPELSRKVVRGRALEAMEQVALPDPLRRYGDYPHQFSGGQRQRILIAMAIVNRPQLLIADEPTTALDVTVQAQILDLLASLRQQQGLAMLFISHDLAVVSQVADRVAILRRGVIVETGPCQQIFHAPADPYTRSLLAAIPTMRTDRSRPLASV